jgi:hypothetical protein
MKKRRCSRVDVLTLTNQPWKKTGCCNKFLPSWPASQEGPGCYTRDVDPDNILQGHSRSYMNNRYSKKKSKVLGCPYPTENSKTKNREPWRTILRKMLSSWNELFSYGNFLVILNVGMSRFPFFEVPNGIQKNNRQLEI